MPRMVCVLLFCLALASAAPGQEPEPQPEPEPAVGTWPVQLNSITHLLMERAPRLQAGFLAEEDQWLLYSRQFDLLSAGGQMFLLRKYGYLPAPAWIAREWKSQAGGAGFQACSAWPAGMSAPPPCPAGQAAQAGMPAPLRFALLAPGVNVKVTLTEAEIRRRLQSETTIAVSGQNIVVGYNDEGDHVSYSTDGGSTWRQSRLSTYPGVLATSGDPVVAAGPNNRFYHSFLAGNTLGQSTIGVARSDNGGASWSAPTNATATVTGTLGGFHDKEWMAVDNHPASRFRGNVYVSWTMFSPQTSSIRFVRSTDGGLTWSQAMAVTELSQQDNLAEQVVQGSFIATGPGGEVYVAWYDSRVNGIRLRQSLDGGATFSDPVTALSPVGFTFSVYLTGNFDVPAFPQIAVDSSSGPSRGTVYVTANALTSAGHMDVFLTRSSDGGATWSAPLRVNNDATTTDQFMPAIAVAENGNVGVAFYDRRNDPDNNSLVDVYLAVSSDSGRTFFTNQRVTTANWPVLPTPLGFRAGYHGDYIQMAVAGNNFYVAWGDDRSGQDPDVYVAVVPASGAVSDFLLATTKAWADVLPGQSAQYALTTGGTSGIALSARSTPPGLTFQFAGSTLTVGTTATTEPGTYTITVNGSSGGLERTTVMRLTVHSPALRQVPVSVTPMRDAAYLAHAFADGAGNVHIVTAHEVEARVRKRLSYTRIPAGGRGPDPAQTIARADRALREQAFLEPHVAAGAGPVYVVWHRSDRTGEHIELSRSTDGRTFSEPVDVSRLPRLTGAPGEILNQTFHPTVAVAPNGTVYVAYILRTLRPLGFNVFLLLANDIFLARSVDNGATFSVPVDLTRVRNVQITSAVSLTVDSADNPHVAYAAATSVPMGPLVVSAQDIFYLRSRDAGRSFDAPANVSRGLDPGVVPQQPALAVDSRNNIYVAWTNPDRRIGQQDILLAKSTDGVRFQTINNLSYATYWTGALADWPALVVDRNGVLSAVWRQSVTNLTKQNDTQRDVFSSQSADGGLNWSSPINLSTNLGDTLLGAAFALAQPPGLAVDREGRVYAFWDDDTAGSTQILMVTLP